MNRVTASVNEISKSERTTYRVKAVGVVGKRLAAARNARSLPPHPAAGLADLRLGSCSGSRRNVETRFLAFHRERARFLSQCREDAGSRA